MKCSRQSVCLAIAIFLIARIGRAQDTSISNEISDDHVEKYTSQPLTTLPTTADSSASSDGVSTESAVSSKSTDAPVSEVPASSSSSAAASGDSSSNEPTVTSAAFSTGKPSSTSTTTVKYPRPLIGPNGIFRVLPSSVAPVSPHAIAGIPRPLNSIRTGGAPNPIPRQGKCSCFAESTTLIRYYRAFEEELQLGDQSLLNCANPVEATEHCETLCKAKAQSEFNEDLDLRSTFSAHPEKRIGQALCSQLGSVLVPTHLHVKSHTVCFGQGWIVARDTGLRSKGRFLCVLGRFQTVP